MGGKSYLGPVEISALVYLVQFKDGVRRASLVLHLFVSDMDPGTKILCARWWAQRLSCAAPGMEWFSLELPLSIKKGCTLEVRCGGVEFVVADENLFDFVI